MEIRTPTEADLAGLTSDKVAFIERLLTAVEREIVPLTQQGVRTGSKIFGGAVLKKSDLATVVAVTNHETANPLNHGEIVTINTFYEIPRDERPASQGHDLPQHPRALSPLPFGHHLGRLGQLLLPVHLRGLDGRLWHSA